MDNAARLSHRAANSPYIHIPDSNVYYGIHDKSEGPLRPISRLEDLNGAAEKEHNRVVSIKFLSRSNFLERIARTCVFTSDNGVIKNAILGEANRIPYATNLVYMEVTINAEFSMWCVASQEDEWIHFIKCFCEYSLLLHPSLFFSGIPYVAVEGMVDFPSAYESPKPMGQTTTLEDRVYSKLSSELASKVTAGMKETTDVNGYTFTLIDLSLVNKISSLVEIQQIDENRYFTTVDAYDEISSILKDNNIGVERTTISVVKDFDTALESVNDDVLRKQIISMESRTGGVSTDPFDTIKSYDKVVTKDSRGAQLFISGSPSDILLSIPGLGFFDSIATMIYTTNGSAMSGGLSAAFFKLLYRKTFSHWILNYAKQENDASDPLFRFDITAMTSGELYYSDLIDGVPSKVSITSRAINKRNEVVSVIERDVNNGMIRFHIPGRLLGTAIDIDFGAVDNFSTSVNASQLEGSTISFSSNKI